MTAFRRSPFLLWRGFTRCSRSNPRLTFTSNPVWAALCYRSAVLCPPGHRL